MTANELRQKYLEFFKSKGHVIIPSASLVPENDPSVLFTTAGMFPLVPYLMGEKHPEGTRLVDVQRCVRTGDIDEVGDASHHTFFEMLGNWSLGDYFKKEAIEMSFEFLTSPKWLGLDKNRIAVSVFAGDDDAPFDEEAFDIWKNLGIPEKRIAKLPKENNWWGMDKGPCGPDTEMFYWTGNPDEIPESFNDDNEKWVEIWNDVFLQYNKRQIASDDEQEYEFLKLEQKDVDTGMGMERILAAVNGLDDNYKTELFWPVMQTIADLTQKEYGKDTEKSFRIIADHLKAATFIISDGIVPSNVQRGYVVRRLIRRAIRHGKQLGIESNFTKQIAKVVIEIYKDAYPEIEKNKNNIFDELEKEENKFGKTLDQGLKEFNKLSSISGKEAFNLYQTYGFPLEMTEELAREKNISVDKKEFEKEFEKHQKLSQTASAGMFKGGLADTSEATKKYHTAAHLLLAALRKVLGEHVFQKGSNITQERLRFDFSHPDKMTEEQKTKVEQLVNEAISVGIPISCQVMSLEEAKKQGAMGVFENKYGDNVKVYTVAPFEGEIFSKEICGGPHVDHTGKLGRFRIIKEESSSAGVRRIKAILE